MVECEEAWLVKQHKLDFSRIPETSHTAAVVLLKLQELCSRWDVSPVKVGDGES